MQMHRPARGLAARQPRAQARARPELLASGGVETGRRCETQLTA